MAFDFILLNTLSSAIRQQALFRYEREDIAGVGFLILSSCKSISDLVPTLVYGICQELMNAIPTCTELVVVRRWTRGNLGPCP